MGLKEWVCGIWHKRIRITHQNNYRVLASKWRVNEEGHIYYINIDLLSYVRDIDIRNIEIWILKGEGMTPEEEFKTKVEEIKQKIMSLGTNSFAEGHERGYESGYKSGYQQCVKDCDKGYEKGLEDMWDVWHWYSQASANDVHNLFPETLKGYTYFVDFLEEIGLAESVRRIKEDKKADAQILYSTISDLKADYTNEQIVKALKDNGIEVEHE